jgi:catechol 2,3-dioxygenase-like lactoylglutathione lyase family enzyme
MAQSLSEAPVWPAIAVKDMAKARKFYEDKLGFKPDMDSEAGVTYKCSDGTGFLLYPSAENAGTNKATYATWSVKDLEGVMADLSAKGVEFEDFDQPDAKTEDHVAKYEEGGKTMRAAWFKDPDGNFLNIVEM